ncbi:hypothetical protein BTVI_06802 [Pitangus sulphuratus]|nr:hypothetical protein BTVI_06802 [Pitangus sulphuratus]
MMVHQRLSNGSIDSNDETSQVVELQELLEKQNYEMAQMKERLAALSSRVGEVEQEAETTRKELIKTEEMNSKYQRDIRELQSLVFTDLRSRELQACQPDLDSQEGYRADHPVCHQMAHPGQPEDQAQPARKCERQDLLDQP